MLVNVLQQVAALLKNFKVADNVQSQLQSIKHELVLRIFGFVKNTIKIGIVDRIDLDKKFENQ